MLPVATSISRKQIIVGLACGKTGIQLDTGWNCRRGRKM